MQGVAPSEIARIRRTVAKAAADRGIAPCPTAVIATELGEGRDPTINRPVAQIDLCQNLWRDMGPAEKETVAGVWQKARPELHRANAEGKMWSNIAGPIRATIATLVAQRWVPHHPAVWSAPCGRLQACIGKTPCSDLEVAQFFKETAEKKVWREAASHYGREGLQQGKPSLTPLRKALSWLRKGGLQEEGSKCHACGSPADDPLHKYWKCPEIRRIPDIEGDIAKRNNLTEGAADGHANLCLWAKGPLPSNCWKVEECNAQVAAQIASETQVIQFGNFAAGNGARTIGTDGSGGAQSVPKELRRVGAGIAGVDMDQSDPRPFPCRSLAVIMSQTPGRQTAPRAEVWALARTCEATNTWTIEETAIDAKYVINGLASPEATGKMQAGTNDDVWKDLLRAKER